MNEKKKIKKFLKIKLKIKIVLKKNYYMKTLHLNNVSGKYIDWINDFEIVKYTEQKFFKQTKNKIKKYIYEKLHSSTDLLLGIFFQQLHIGNIKLGNINWTHSTCDISFIIGDNKFLKKGIGTLAIRKMVNFAFKKLRLKKINAGYYSNNIASKKVLKKCGFVIEGKKRKNISFNGKRIDIILAGIFINE